jgi:hypothetical protein
VSEHAKEQALRECAYFLWEHEGRPEGRAFAHWEQALTLHVDQGQSSEDEFGEDAEAVLAGDPHADLPALLTKDVPGG